MILFIFALFVNYDLFPTVGVRLCVKMARTLGSSDSRFFGSRLGCWCDGVDFLSFVERRVRFCLSFGLILVDKFVRSTCSFYFRESVR